MLGQLQRLSTQVCVGSASCEEPKRLFTDFLSRGDFPKKSLLAFFLVFLTAAHRVTLSDCLQRPADGLRKSRQHFILIFGEGEIVLFEEETLVGGRKVQLGGARGQSACTARRLTPTLPKDDLLLGILTFTRPRICRIARLSLDTKQSNQGKTSMTGFWMTRP